MSACNTCARSNTTPRQTSRTASSTLAGVISLSAPASSWTRLATHRAWLDAEAARLIGFARGSRVPGGFAWLDDRGEPDTGRPLLLWITARMTHVFALGELLGHPGCGALTDHGLVALRGGFEDQEHSGWYSEVTAGGPVRTDKEAYPHSFVLLAAAIAQSGATIERTQTVNLLRESLYRTCERYLSGAISKPTLIVQAARDQRAMVTVLAIEQLTRAIRPAATIISAGPTSATVPNTALVELVADLRKEEKVAATAPIPSPTSAAITVSISTPPGGVDVARGVAAAAHIRRSPTRAGIGSAGAWL